MKAREAGPAMIAEKAVLRLLGAFGLLLAAALTVLPALPLSAAEADKGVVPGTGSIVTGEIDGTHFNLGGPLTRWDTDPYIPYRLEIVELDLSAAVFDARGCLAYPPGEDDITLTGKANISFNHPGVHHQEGSIVCDKELLNSETQCLLLLHIMKPEQFRAPRLQAMVQAFADNFRYRWDPGAPAYVEIKLFPDPSAPKLMARCRRTSEAGRIEDETAEVDLNAGDGPFGMIAIPFSARLDAGEIVLDRVLYGRPNDHGVVRFSRPRN